MNKESLRTFEELELMKKMLRVKQVPMVLLAVMVLMGFIPAAMAAAPSNTEAKYVILMIGK